MLLLHVLLPLQGCLDWVAAPLGPFVRLWEGLWELLPGSGGVHGVPSLSSVYVVAVTTRAKWPRSVSIDWIARAQSLTASWILSMEV